MERYPPDPRGKHVLVYWFMPGYSYLNILTLLYAAVFNLTLLTMVNFVQPYLLEEVLQIPRGEQGALTGFLAALQEVVVISLMGLVGALSDRTGRRVLFAIGFVILSLGYFLYPLASSPEQLIAFRVVVAVGAAILPVMLGASLIDIIQECSRGKWLGTTSIFNGIGVILMSIVFGQLPERFEWMGFSGALAGRYTFWIAAAVGIVSAIVLRLGFKGGPPPEVKDKPSVLKNFARGITEARRNPRIALAYASGFHLARRPGGGRHVLFPVVRPGRCGPGYDRGAGHGPCRISVWRRDSAFGHLLGVFHGNDLRPDKPHFRGRHRFRHRRRRLSLAWFHRRSVLGGKPDSVCLHRHRHRGDLHGGVFGRIARPGSATAIPWRRGRRL